MLVNLNNVLIKARKEYYSVPAFDCTEELIRPILDECEKMGSPVILMALEHDLKEKGIVYISSIVKGVAAEYNIPIVLHLDHATNIEIIKRAIEYGFTSVMYDGSTLSFEENVKNTKEVVELAHPLGISVEAELGRVAGSDLDGAYTGEMSLTKAKDVSKFIELTGIDALAVSIGTSHGLYVSLPKLNIERLKEINEISTVPLVLHGGSGTPVDQVREAIKNGISKVNLYSDIRTAMTSGAKKSFTEEKRVDALPDQLFMPIKDAIKNAVKLKIEMTMSQGRA
ncbi:MAG TPA: class II fructose-bisphosphate aldolase [Clostridium sp.]|uniref:class II fructose-bisphosphate aldolase n=1 Tax=Clostridium sp. TaxID=1506 RepID=UPI002F9410C2